jgi:hypothetical protein
MEPLDGLGNLFILHYISRSTPTENRPVPFQIITQLP